MELAPLVISSITVGLFGMVVVVVFIGLASTMVCIHVDLIVVLVSMVLIIWLLVGRRIQFL